MAKKIKISRKQIQQPDEFITWFDRTIDYMRAHSLEAALGVLAVFAVLAIGQGVRYYQQYQRESAIQALTQALMILQSPLQNELTDQQILSGVKTYPSAQERTAAAVAKFNQLIHDHPRSPQARQARLYLAGLQRETQDHRAAIESYKAYLQAEANLAPELKVIALMGLGASYFDLGNYQEARNAFQQIIDLPEAFNRDEALMSAAACEEKLGHWDAAIALLKQAETEYPDTVATRNASVKIQWLEKIKESSPPSPAGATPVSEAAAKKTETAVQKKKPTPAPKTPTTEPSGVSLPGPEPTLEETLPK